MRVPLLVLAEEHVHDALDRHLALQEGDGGVPEEAAESDEEEGAEEHGWRGEERGEEKRRRGEEEKRRREEKRREGTRKSGRWEVREKQGGERILERVREREREEREDLSLIRQSGQSYRPNSVQKIPSLVRKVNPSLALARISVSPATQAR